MAKITPPAAGGLGLFADRDPGHDRTGVLGFQLGRREFFADDGPGICQISHDFMRTRNDLLAGLVDPGIIAVVRAQRRDQVLGLTEALLAGGVQAIEITLTTPDACAAIADMRRQFGRAAMIGAGTVVTVDQCRAVLAAGAEFVVTPLSRPDFVPLIHAADRVGIIGAFTPSEAQTAHEAGADFIKLFPAEVLGPAFIKALRAPLPQLRFIPTGGVALDNVGVWFAAGCPAVGVGSSLLTREILAKDDWPALTRRAGEFVAAARAARSG
jgi:2-dehydro-3-deoxyphosphogluconate aldolase/(4S)-4-hydroxy-2-oxoglutarate aldolase